MGTGWMRVYTSTWDYSFYDTPPGEVFEEAEWSSPDLQSESILAPWLRRGVCLEILVDYTHNKL